MKNEEEEEEVGSLWIANFLMVMVVFLFFLDFVLVLLLKNFTQNIVLPI